MSGTERFAPAPDVTWYVIPPLDVEWERAGLERLRAELLEEPKLGSPLGGTAPGRMRR